MASKMTSVNGLTQMVNKIWSGASALIHTVTTLFRPVKVMRRLRITEDQFRAMNDHQLRDIGFNRTEALFINIGLASRC